MTSDKRFGFTLAFLTKGSLKMNANAGFAFPVGAPPDYCNHGAFVPISPSNGGGSHLVLPKLTSMRN
jgi:hypothetical protein